MIYKYVYPLLKFEMYFEKWLYNYYTPYKNVVKVKIYAYICGRYKQVELDPF